MTQPGSPAEFLARAVVRARKDAMSQVFESEPLSETQAAFDDEHVLSHLTLLHFSPAGKIAASHLVSHGLTQAHLRAPHPGQIVDERFAGLGMEICVAFEVQPDADAAVLLTTYATLVFEAAEALVAEAPFRTLLPGDILQTDDEEPVNANAPTPPFSWLVVDGAPFRSRLVLPTGHCHLVQLVPFHADDVDATAHLAGEQRALLFELLDMNRSANVHSESMCKHPAFEVLLRQVEG